jgi:hypothetical protein
MVPLLRDISPFLVFDGVYTGMSLEVRCGPAPLNTYDIGRDRLGSPGAEADSRLRGCVLDSYLTALGQLAGNLQLESRMRRLISLVLPKMRGVTYAGPECGFLSPPVPAPDLAQSSTELEM